VTGSDEQLAAGPDFVLYQGDCLDVLRTFKDRSVDAVVTSPPYLDARPEYDGPGDFDWMLIFRELARVVSGGMLWNVGRIWRGGIEQLWWTRLIALAGDEGWEHWDTRLWLKPNANPIHGKLFTNSHEYILAFGRKGVEFNVDAIRRPHAESTKARFGRGWTNHKGVKNPIASKARRETRAEPNPLGALPRSYFEACVGREKGNKHPAPMALDVALELVAFASWPGQTVLDPFAGSGTTGRAARTLNRRSVLIERNPEFAAMCADRLALPPLLEGTAA
jgi:DNA modification methylase